MTPEVMTVEQVAKYLQLDEQTVYRKARLGEIPAVHIGRILRFKKDVLDSWLRITSLRWTASKRRNLRDWAETFAKEAGVKETNIERAISRRRHGG